MNSAVSTLLKEAAEWRLFALLFEYPTDAWRSNLESLLTNLAESELQALAQAALQQSSEGLHIALFGPGGTVPVREVAHRGGVQFGYLMAELSAYYDAFGFKPETEEAVDHLSVQLSFVAFLRMKQAAAMLAEEHEHEQITSDAVAAFIKEHLSIQAEPVAQAMENFGPEFLVAAARLVVQRVGPSPQPTGPLGAPIETIDDSEDMSCGSTPSSDNLIQLQP